MDALAKLLLAVLAWLESKWPSIATFSSGFALRDWLDKRRKLQEAEAENASLRRVLGAPRADGMQRDKVVSELKRRSLWRISGK